MEYLHRTWATIDLDCIRKNYDMIQKMLSPGAQMMAVVKADAYGHGDGFISRSLQSEGVNWFGVSNINEAVSLRKQGIDRSILILGYTPPEYTGRLAAFGLTQTIYSVDYARELSAAACGLGVKLDCHIKVDTGMTRIGFFAQYDSCAEAAQQIMDTYRLPGLTFSGIFTHFACADEKASDSVAYTRRQYADFTQVIDALAQNGITFPLKHCCNSAGTLMYPEMHMDMVRAGNILYGLSPSDDCKDIAPFEPAMSLYATVTMIKDVAQGAAVSYGRRYHTDKEITKIASVSVGYADGYRRSFSNRARVIVAGQYAPVIGTVCMDQMMIDVTGISGIEPGSVVTLAGRENEKSITLDDFAVLNGSINYEETCLIGRRVPRVYKVNGKEVAAIDYVISTLDDTLK